MGRSLDVLGSFKYSWRQALYPLVSLLVSVCVLWMLLSDISPGDVWRLIEEADRQFVCLFLLASVTGVFFRTLRYQLLLSGSGYLVSTPVMFLVVLVRNLCVDLLPARLGSLVYVAILTTKLKVPLTVALPSWAFEIIFDLIAVVPLLFLAALTLSSNLPIHPFLLILAALLLSIVFIAGLWCLPLILARLSSFFSKAESHLTNSRFSKFANLCSKLSKFTDESRGEVIRCRGAGIYGKLVVISVLIRLCKYTSLYLFLLALLRPLGYGISSLPPGVVFLGLFSAEISATLPISGIAGIGAYQGAWIAVFTILGLPMDIAKLTSLSHHLFTQAYGYGLGIIAALILSIPGVSGVAKKGDVINIQTLFRQLLCFFCFVVISGVAITQVSSAKSSPVEKASTQLRPTAQQGLANLGVDVLFDSNRSGSFGIYRTSFSEGLILPVYDSPAHEMFPDAAPDGQAVIFSQARSLQRGAPASVYQISLVDNKLTLITSDGTFPTYGSDGKSVFFERDRAAVWEYRFDSKTETQIFPLEAGNFKGEIVKPRVSSDRRWLFFTSDKPRKWSSWRVDLLRGSVEHMSEGCEAFPGRESSQMVWINTKNAREFSGIYLLAAPGSDPVEVLDAGAPRGREYFPSLSCAGRYLLWSASSPGQHSHESADYQVFVRDEQTKTVWQVTEDTFTNRWPKVLRCPK